jgi:hypothetical protein
VTITNVLDGHFAGSGEGNERFAGRIGVTIAAVEWVPSCGPQ